MRVESWSRRRRRSSVRSGSTAGACAAAGFACLAPGSSLWTTLMGSASAEEVAGELAALAALGTGLALAADLDLRGRQLDAVLGGSLLGAVGGRARGRLRSVVLLRRRALHHRRAGGCPGRGGSRGARAAGRGARGDRDDL